MTASHSRESDAIACFWRHEDACVEAEIDLPLGVRVRCYSDDATSPREWRLEEVEVIIDADRRLDHQALKPSHHLPPVVMSGDLRDFLDREWDREIDREARHG